MTWNAATQQIAITLNNETWTLAIGSTLADNQYGQTKTLSVAPKLTEDGRTLVHIRALELFSGVTCSWNNMTQQVYIAYTVINEVPDPEEDPEDEIEYLWLDLDGDASINLELTYADGGSETYEDVDLTDVGNAFSMAIRMTATKTTWITAFCNQTERFSLFAT